MVFISMMSLLFSSCSMIGSFYSNHFQQLLLIHKIILSNILNLIHKIIKYTN